ncbi:unnamed protein product [Blepharisma stoltei]|uniref:Uncharacterized protein n=1 Tax=Blepharisma stoltei TaxID=1481888 RepID=A0AAU9K504_9CILI|nr:unnamed protein product [Blepharisma stoltei]
MSLRAQAPIAAAPIVIQNINKTRYKSSSKEPSSTRPRSIDSQRRLNSRVNKSFTVHHETPTALCSNRNQSFTIEKSRNISLGCSTPKNKNPSKGNIRSTSKLVSGHPCPRDLEEREILYRKEIINSLFERGKSEMKLGEYTTALGFFKKVLKEDPNHVEAIFDKASCYIYLGEHKKAIPDLLTLTKDYPYYDRQVYSALAMCFVAVGDLITAVRQISRGLIKFPKFVEGYITRGKLYNEQKKWDKAILDFHKAIELNGNDGNGYLGLADALLGMEDSRSALKMLGSAIQCPNTSMQALLQRAKIHYELHENDKALKDLDLLLANKNDCTEAFYYKALVLLSQENLSDAALCLEQAIKYDVYEQKFTGAAIYNLGAIKIKQKDYYGAMHTFQRSISNNVDIKEQSVLIAYTDAILNLMKRKFKEGVSMLSKIIKKRHPVLQEFLGNCFAYRGYGLASLGSHEKALKDFMASSRIQPLDNASEYNMLISQAIVVSETDLETALSLFKSAAEHFPKNTEPLAYQAATLLKLSRLHNKTALADQAGVLLTKAIESRETESELYFYRGIVLYFLGKPIDAVTDMESAMEKSEENMPMHFLARGLCYVTLKLIKEAIEDFSIAIQLDEKLAEAYFYRGRCAYLLDDTQLAFLDFQKLIVAKPKDPIVHVHAGNLLMLTNSIEDATKAFSNANSIKPTITAYVQSAKCSIINRDIDKSIEELTKACEIDMKNEITLDISVLQAIKDAHKKEDLKGSLTKSINLLSQALKSNSEGEICKPKQVHWYKGIFNFFLGDFEKAQSEFKNSLSKKEIAEMANASPIEQAMVEKENAELIYNVALCYILEEYYEAAFMHLHEILPYTEGSDRGKLLLLIGILHLGLEQTDEAREFMVEGFKFDSETVSAYLEEKKDVKILPFNSGSTYASRFPMARIKVKNTNPVLIRPTFNLPRIRLPVMDFQTEDFILDQFGVKSIKSKPEAPWLNRVNGGIQFTENIQEIVSQTVSESEEEEDSKSDKESKKFSEESSSLFGGENRTFKSDSALPKHDENDDIISEYLKRQNIKQEIGTPTEGSSSDVKNRLQFMLSPNYEMSEDILEF